MTSYVQSVEEQEAAYLEHVGMLSGHASEIHALLSELQATVRKTERKIDDSIEVQDTDVDGELGTANAEDLQHHMQNVALELRSALRIVAEWKRSAEEVTR